MPNETLRPRISPAQLALARVTHQLEKVTSDLIRLVFEQGRNSSPEIDARVQQLEAQRDDLHGRLQELEGWAKRLALPG